jgi:hypothetical protein
VYWIQDTKYSLIRAEATSDTEKLNIAGVRSEYKFKFLMSEVSNWQNLEQQGGGVVVFLQSLIISVWSFWLRSCKVYWKCCS